ncbi:MAG: tail fiber domain-containing protein, partial [Bacteroidota bacterium]
VEIKDGTFNTALGSETGDDLEDGDYNTLLGFVSGKRLINHQGNTFAGYESGYYVQGDKNVIIGYLAGDDGYDRDAQNTVYVGSYADGWGTRRNAVCLGVGARAQYDGVSIGYITEVKEPYSVGLGYDGNSDSDGSVGMGYQFNVAGGNFSIGIGDQADIDNSYAVGIGTSVNIDNTEAIAIGDNTSATGNYSIAYGPSASVSGNNSVALGNGVSVTTDHTITIGNSAVTSIRGTVNWTTLSDGRYKTAVKKDVPGLAFIDALRPVSYELNAQPGIRYSGFIAQEVEAAAESLGYDFSGVKKAQHEQDHYGLRYAAFVVPLTKAVQELDEEYKENEAQITQNETKLQYYASAIAQLKAKVAQLQQRKAASNATVAVD